MNATRTRLPLLLPVVLVLAATGCTLERRGNGDAAVAEPATVLDGERLEPPAPQQDPAESARVTLEVFREAVRVGDLSLALSLIDPRAVLLDDLSAPAEAGPADPMPTRGELLLELRRRHAGGLLLRVDGSELRWLDDHALLMTRIVLLHRSTVPDQEPDSVGVARETALLRPTPEGWRIVHLHRSLGALPEAVAPVAGGSP